MSAWMNRRVTSKLRELLAKDEHHREAIREFSLAGFAPMVERHRAKLRKVQEEIRECCREDDATLPPAIFDEGPATLRPFLQAAPQPQRFPYRPRS